MDEIPDILALFTTGQVDGFHAGVRLSVIIVESAQFQLSPPEIEAIETFVERLLSGLKSNELDLDAAISRLVSACRAAAVDKRQFHSTLQADND